MKRLMLISLLISGMLLLAAPRPARADVTVSVGFFHDELSPYGRWAPCAYGECWVPTGVAAGWQPYSNGEWMDTDYGWTWVSYDPWGGDPFHYGSWTWLDDDDDWAWVPGTVWAPAWVTWCWDGDDIGWAPLPPGFAFTATGFFGSPVIDPPRSYVFVPGRQFLASNVSAVRLPAARNAAILPRMQSATAFRVSGGIVRDTALPVSRVERATERTVARRSISAARTDPRPVPRTTAGRRLTLAAPARVLRAEIGPEAASPARNANVHRAAASAPRRPAQKASRSSSSTSRSASSSRKPASPSRAKAAATQARSARPQRSRPPAHRAAAAPRRTSKPSSAKASRTTQHRPAAERAKPAVKASSPAHAAPRARTPEPRSAARPARERAPAPVARRTPVEASHPAPQPRAAARPAPEPRAAAHPAPRPMPAARPTPPPRPKEKKPGQE